jgi:hypothetical protein
MICLAKTIKISHLWRSIKTNDMKQTAVEWLVEQILTEVQDYEDGDIETELEPFKHEYVNKYIGMIDLSEFVNKAKEMERDQIMSAFTQGDIFGADYYDGVNITEENYYKQTFEYESNPRI